MTWNPSYAPTILAMACAGGLLLLQLIIADLVAIRAGHRAGTPIPVDFRSFLFRAARAHANTNESVAAFALLAVSGMAAGAHPLALNALTWSYLACRLGHMVAYYMNRKAPRSAAFGLSLLALLGMLATTLLAW